MKRYLRISNFNKSFPSVTLQHNAETKKKSPAKSPNISGFFATQTAIFHCAKTQMQNRRFPFADRLELPKSEYPIHRQVEIKNLSAFFIALKKACK